MPLRKYITALIMMFALFATSCRSPKETTELRHIESVRQTDSVSLTIKQTARPVTIPQTTAKINLTPEALEALPVGGQYQAKDGQATATIERTKDGYQFHANCDSLTLIITDLEKELTRYRSDNTALQEQIKQKPVQVNVLSPWQAFRIKVGNVTLCLLAVAALVGGYKLFNFIKSKIQK